LEWLCSLNGEPLIKLQKKRQWRTGHQPALRGKATIHCPNRKLLLVLFNFNRYNLHGLLLVKIIRKYGINAGQQKTQETEFEHS
jgi:hypothetical protein